MKGMEIQASSASIDDAGGPRDGEEGRAFPAEMRAQASPPARSDIPSSICRSSSSPPPATA